MRALGALGARRRGRHRRPGGQGARHPGGGAVRTFGEHDLDELASLLRRSHVAAIPTDTVYGLAASPSSARAIEAIYRLKGRPSSLALPVLAATLDDVLALLGQLPPVAVTRRLAGSGPGR